MNNSSTKEQVDSSSIFSKGKEKINISLFRRNHQSRKDSTNSSNLLINNTMIIVRQAESSSVTTRLTAKKSKAIHLIKVKIPEKISTPANPKKKPSKKSKVKSPLCPKLD